MKKAKQPVIKTKRMILSPMTDEEIEALIRTAASEELQRAYGEMFSGCRRDPDNRVWYAPWKMMLKGEQACLGVLGLKGPARESTVEISYGVLPEHEGKGYATEAVQAMTQWAFGAPEVVFVEAKTEPGNEASRRVLQKCGFEPDGDGLEEPRFVLENPLTSWMTIYMLFGLSIGTALGASFGSVGIGLSLGLCAGLCIGVALDASAKKERERLRAHRHGRQRHIRRGEGD